MKIPLDLCGRPAAFVRQSWWALALRLIVGYGFMEHGYAKLARGPAHFAGILHALHMPAAGLLAWATILTELIGGFAVLIGALVPLISVPMAIVLITAILTVHLPNGFSSIKLLAVTPAGAYFGQPGYETDLLYLACLAALVLGGSGPFSLDSVLTSNSHKRISRTETAMKLRNLTRSIAGRAGVTLTASLLATSLAVAADADRGVLVLTSTNNPDTNQVLVYQVEPGATSLSLVQTLPTGGRGGASGNAGIVQMKDDIGAVANYGSGSVSQFVREGDWVAMRGQIRLAPGCVKPDSVALTREQLFVAGANCVESHAWPSGIQDGAVVHLSDTSAAQVAVGRTWGAVTFTSGAVDQVGLNGWGALSGAVASVPLPSDANNTPLGAAFWGDILGFNPAHSPDSFALVDAQRNVYPVAGPTPSYPTNAPCWIAKGPGNVWYTGNSPGQAISIFFSDGKGGVFYKSVPLPGAPTDITVSKNRKWLAVIYSANGNGYVAAYAIDKYGDLTPAGTSSPIGVAAFSGVAISE
jgi:putative oxidoreductase